MANILRTTSQHRMLRDCSYEKHTVIQLNFHYSINLLIYIFGKSLLLKFCIWIQVNKLYCQLKLFYMTHIWGSVRYNGIMVWFLCKWFLASPLRLHLYEYIILNVFSAKIKINVKCMDLRVPCLLKTATIAILYLDLHSV